MRSDGFIFLVGTFRLHPAANLQRLVHIPLLVTANIALDHSSPCLYPNIFYSYRLICRATWRWLNSGGRWSLNKNFKWQSNHSNQALNFAWRDSLPRRKERDRIKNKILSLLTTPRPYSGVLLRNQTSNRSILGHFQRPVEARCNDLEVLCHSSWHYLSIYVPWVLLQPLEHLHATCYQKAI